MMEVVNGYVCKNCTDVEYAKKGIDPARPKDGPEGAYESAREDDAKAASNARADRGPAVSFGGELARLQQQASPSQAVTPTPYVPGANVSLSV